MIRTQPVYRFFAALVVAGVALTALSACGSKEEKAPAGYYEGPRKPKTVAGDQNAPATGNPGSGTSVK